MDTRGNIVRIFSRVILFVFSSVRFFVAISSPKVSSDFKLLGCALIPEPHQHNHAPSETVLADGAAVLADAGSEAVPADGASCAPSETVLTDGAAVCADAEAVLAEAVLAAEASPGTAAARRARCQNSLTLAARPRCQNPRGYY